MSKKILASIYSLLIGVIAPLFSIIPVAHAATDTCTWTGSGDGTSFSDGTNWSGCDNAGVPETGDSLDFPTSVEADTVDGNSRMLNNDLVGMTFAGIQVIGTYIAGDYDNYQIAGNAFGLSGNVTGNGSSPVVRQLNINVAVTATTNLTLQSVYMTVSLDIGSNTVTLTDSGNSGSYSGSGGSLILGGSEETGGGSGGGCTYTAGPSSPGFTSSITIAQYGSMLVRSNTQEAAYSANGLTLNNGGYLGFAQPFGQDMAFNKAINFNGGTFSASQNSDDNNDCASPTTNKQLTIPGNVTLTADTEFLMYNVDIKFTGTVTGKEFIKPYFASSGVVLFSDGSSIKPTPKTTNYSANSPGTTIYVNNNETAVVTGVYGDTTVGSGGTIKGSGTVGALYINSGGHLAPGLSPGCINSGNLTLTGTFDAEIGGTTACTEYDQTTVTGSVNVTGGTLSVSRYNDFKPAAGQTYTIISNDAADAVTGTFNGLAQGATFTVNGYVFAISYTGGDGNDVVLTVQSVPAAPNTGFKLLRVSPVTTLATTLLSTAVLLVLARRAQLLKK